MNEPTFFKFAQLDQEICSAKQSLKKIHFIRLLCQFTSQLDSAPYPLKGNKKINKLYLKKTFQLEFSKFLMKSSYSK